MTKKKPVFLRFRSSNLYILVTVSMSLFTDMIVYSIIVPIMPFVINALENGRSPDTEKAYTKEITDGGNVSKETGSLLALFAVGLLVGSPVFGYLADRLEHRKWPMVAGIVGLLGATFLFLFANSYWEFYLARFLQGLSDACVWTLGMCLIADTFSLEVLGTQMGRVLMFHTIGLLCGSPIGGALYQSVGYKAPFILCICLAGIDLILRLFVVERRNQPREWFEDNKSISKPTVATSTLVSQPISEGNKSLSKEKKKNKVTVIRLLRQNRLLASLLLSFANGCVYNVFEPTLTVRLSSEWGYNSTQIGLVFLAQVIPTFVATPLAGYITDKYGPKVVAFTTLVVCAITMFLIGIPSKSTAGGVAPLIVVFAIQGFTAFAFITPVLPEIAHVVQSLNSNNGDDGQGMSYALFNITFGLGGLVGPLLGGYLYDKIGFFYMCVVMGCFLVICAPYVFKFTGEPGKFIVRPNEREDQSPDMIEIDSEIAAENNVARNKSIDQKDNDYENSGTSKPKETTIQFST